MDRLDVVQDHRWGQSYVCWFCDGEQGLCIGELTSVPSVKKALERGRFEDAECYAVEAAARACIRTLPKGAARRIAGSLQFWFDDLRDAKKVLRAGREAQRAVRIKIAAMRKNKPESEWPIWAIQAKKAGWKPPKGWSP